MGKLNIPTIAEIPNIPGFVATGSSGDDLLLETGDYLLLETSDYLLLE